jgi:broad specificity phosphatase PhoE
MTLQTIWIARHGNRLDFVYPEWFNTAKRRYDPPLSKDGLIQANLLAKRLKNENINHIFVSPFLRTIQTAYPLAQILNLPLKIEQGLSEWLNQEWMTEMPKTEPKNELKIKFPLIDWHYQSLVIPQYPETETQVKQRSAKTIIQLIENYQENILLIGHSVSVQGCVLELLKENTQINTPLCSLTKLIKEQDQWQLKLNGDISHLW